MPMTPTQHNLQLSSTFDNNTKSSFTTCGHQKNTMLSPLNKLRTQFIAAKHL